jgi:hypothetical protein
MGKDTIVLQQAPSVNMRFNDYKKRRDANRRSKSASCMIQGWRHYLAFGSM